MGCGLFKLGDDFWFIFETNFLLHGILSATVLLKCTPWSNLPVLTDSWKLIFWLLLLLLLLLIRLLMLATASNMVKVIPANMSGTSCASLAPAEYRAAVRKPYRRSPSQNFTKCTCERRQGSEPAGLPNRVEEVWRRGWIVIKCDVCRYVCLCVYDVAQQCCLLVHWC